MRLLGGLFAGIAVFLVAAELAGVGLRPRRRSKHHRRRVAVAHWLAQAGVHATAGQLASVCIGAGLAVLAAGVFLTGTLVVAVLPAAAVSVAPIVYYSAQRRRRLAERVAAWPDALRAVVSALEAGMSLHQALAGLATGGPAALRSSFGRYAALTPAIGSRAALERIRTEMAEPVTDSVIEILQHATRIGASTAVGILRDLADDVTADLQTIERIDTLSLEQRLSARAVFVLPYLTLVVLCLRAGPFRDFYRSTAGLIVATVGGVLSAAGITIIGRLATPAVTERLFTGERRTLPDPARGDHA